MLPNGYECSTVKSQKRNWRLELWTQFKQSLPYKENKIGNDAGCVCGVIYVKKDENKF